MRMVRAILIDPFACSVTEIEHDGDDYKSMYPLLSHESMPVSTFQLVPSPILEPGDAVFVDEEGLMKPCERWFKIAGFEQPLAGKGLVVGSDNNGDTASARTSVEAVKAGTIFGELHGSRLVRITTPWIKKENVK
jgi:hypothetical protein